MSIIATSVLAARRCVRGRPAEAHGGSPVAQPRGQGVLPALG
eukprot:CAMPEP_0195126520 /NCGR_PEP_ID=MMETSP0448-20130528/135113_1 /TAXON_ID=66468 /ORGANISM="Heterocapsa triquestra, Strain CCMP 448" /LENGTH=41 /DNA_ID= /DNA_START= /DNA_END= /DNA_ORIENTATION=